MASVGRAQDRFLDRHRHRRQRRVPVDISSAIQYSKTHVQGKIHQHLGSDVLHTQKMKAEYFEQGYTIVDNVVEADMLDRLESGARNIWEQIRSGRVDVAGGGPDSGSI